MIRAKTIAACAALALTAGHALADPETAKEHLEKATEALKEAKGLSFRLKLTSSGFVSMKGESSVVMARKENQPRTWQIRRTGTAEMGDQKQEYDVISEGEIVRWIDHDEKKVMERFRRAARSPQLTIAHSAWIPKLIESSPFSQEMEAEDLTYQGTSEVNGVMCHVVEAKVGENRGTHTWAFGADDYLPRRFEWVLAGGGFSSSSTFDLTNVKLNPELPEGTFEFEVPEGYEKDMIAAGSPGLIPAGPERQGDTPLVPAQPAGSSPTRPAPEFELTDAEGEKVKLEDLRGSVVVLEFMHTWSGISQRAAPEAQAYWERFKDQGVKVYAVPIRVQDKQRTLEHFSRNDLTYGVLFGGDETAELYHVRKFPTYYLIDGQGRIVFETGYTPEQSFADLTRLTLRLLSGEAGGDEGGEGAPAGIGGGLDADR